MHSASCFSNRCMSRTVKIMFLTLITVMTAMAASAAPPVGQTIWIRASANGRFVSADQARGAFAPLPGRRVLQCSRRQDTVVRRLRLAYFIKLTGRLRTSCGSGSCLPSGSALRGCGA